MRMSKVAGFVLLIFGVVIAYVGVREILHAEFLTPFAAYSSVAFGILLCVAGLGHFRAPHKSFLISVPVLLAFQLHMYCIALFYDVKNPGVFLGSFAVASFLILYLSYLGYRHQAAER